MRTGIEYDGPYHNSKEALERDIKKYKICKAEGIRLIRVSLRDEAPPEPICDVFIHSDYNFSNYDALDKIMNRISEYVPLGGGFDTKRHLLHIKHGYLQSIKKNSLANKHPELSLEWNYEKNNGLTPFMFSSGSGENVWWRCQLGHEWPATIVSRNRGNGCPYCSGQKVLSGFNDLAYLRPDLAKEWDYEKNESLLPTEVTVHSSKKAWWICPKGHGSYRKCIAERSAGQGCRLCKNAKIGAQFSKQVFQYSPDGVLLNSFFSATEAGKRLGVSSSAISKACRGLSKSCAGYIFKYSSDEQEK